MAITRPLDRAAIVQERAVGAGEDIAAGPLGHGFVDGLRSAAVQGTDEGEQRRKPVGSTVDPCALLTMLMEVADCAGEAGNRPAREGH
jgi:hypothetical protein